MREIWFWQRIVSPHMAGLARALARQGCKVTYVAERDLSDDRKQLGWSVPTMDGVDLRFASHPLEVAECVAAAGCDSVHLCQGLRANGLVSNAQKHLAERGLRQWVLMETIGEHGWVGPIKRAVYAALFRQHRARIKGVLALGHRTSGWVADRGMPQSHVFPFAYFLEDRPTPLAIRPRGDAPFRVAFVGQFIELKRLPLLVDALANLKGSSAELVVVGSGALERRWRTHAERRMPNRVRWLGALPSAQVLELLGEVDCLVLPSRYDGWGAVISEALMAGTPVICSDCCGAAGAVSASGVGGVFERDDEAGLAALLARAIAAGPSSTSDREALSRWAASLGAEAGGRYLLDILAHVDGTGARPESPWMRGTPPCAV